ncbi:conserved hypothetical protein [Aeropyrum pernix K1]|uniref:CASTOR ACT domain-containing protein n=1 Tax=Aeropyrum pernix (strain ATCC 700893 / DSM 11879 / JCM 9820 / NBRC 100138 / K1) TaxID=272557 RepID=Q9YAP9_AERPE|nr:ACT domain-containing protein [Aeropyrum pernix]BAA80899.1 conserved hypothetical protein [Aeropyrum pernix K1]
MSGVTAKLVREYVAGDPVLLECLRKGIVNYSALARRLAEDLEKATGEKHSVVAVKMALVRLAEKLESEPIGEIERIIAASALAVQDYISVITVPRESITRALKIVSQLGENSRFIQFVQSLRTATIIVASEDKEKILERLQNVIEVIDRQSAVILVSPRSIVTTPGVVAYITGFLARSGINITQVISCYVDTILVLNSEEASKAYTLLHRLIDALRRKYSVAEAAVGTGGGSTQPLQGG